MFYEIIHDSGETRNKCTIAPLAGRPDFKIIPVVGAERLGPLKSDLLLHADGECLSKIKKRNLSVSSIASIDCVWPRLEGLVKRIDQLPSVFARIPDGFVTVYPRGTRLGAPPAGLATIEAIFIASALLGNWDTSLLSHYHFGRKFIEANRDVFLQFGVKQAADEALLPAPILKSKNALQRRRDRGRIIQH